MSVELDRVGWEDGTLVSPAKVNVGGTVYEVEPEVVTGTTPTSAENFKKMEDNAEKAVNEGILDANTYSTTEKRIGSWIDEEPLYEKVINFGVCPDNSSKSVAHNINNLKRIIRLFGFAGSSTSKGGITLPHGSSNPIALYADDTNVTVNAFQNASAYTQTYIWVQYTKTTD